MFEFHGWAVLRASTSDDDEQPDLDLLKQFRAEVARLASASDARPPCSDFVHTSDVVWNGMTSFTVSGLLNHRREYVLQLFRWLAERGPGSYGLLYIWDDESEHPDVFRVWRLARGTLTEEADPFLSPPIPTLEDACDF